MPHQPTDEELLQEARRLRKTGSGVEPPPLRHDVPLRATRSVIDDLRSLPIPDTTNEIYGILLSLNAISAYAAKAAAEHPISPSYGEHLSGLAMECRSVLEAVQSALPLLFQATGRPSYDIETAEVAELRNVGGWIPGLDDRHAEAYALAWFSRLAALLTEKLAGVRRWSTERELGTPVRVVQPLLDRLQSFQHALTEATAANGTASEQQRLTERLRSRS